MGKDTVPIKVTETVTRDCCNLMQDLKAFHGDPPIDEPNGKFRFCKHCGQLWAYGRTPGDMDYGWDKLKIISSTH